MTIRAALPGDLPALMRIERESFGDDAWSESLVASELAGVPRTRFVAVAESDDGVEGYASLLAVADSSDVQRIAVRPDARRCGLGGALLSRLLDQSRARGCARTLLEVRADNAEALALYGRFGFAEIDRRAGYYGGDVDALVMCRDDTG